MLGDTSRDGEEGIALLAVMLCLVVVSILALGMIMATRSGVMEVSSDLNESEMSAFYDAVVVQSASDILDTKSPDRPRIDGTPLKIHVLGQDVLVSISSEFGKVDLNAADTTSLKNLLEAAGLGPAESVYEADQIVMYRSPGDGTETTRPFRVTEEIMRVPGITSNLYSAIGNDISVYSDRGQIDESTAPLLALQSIEGVDHLTAASIIRDRSSDLNHDQSGEVIDGQLQPGISIVGWAFLIDSQFSVGRRNERAETVIRMTGDLRKPYFVLWRQEQLD